MRLNPNRTYIYYYQFCCRITYNSNKPLRCSAYPLEENFYLVIITVCKLMITATKWAR